MVFNKLGGIYYTETYEINKVDYGGSIPCFIGRTINPNKDYTTEATNKLIEENNAKETPVQNYTPSTTEINNKITQLKEEELAKHRINQLLVFNNFEQANRTTLDENGKMLGLGDYETEKEQNPLLNTIHDFCEETKMMTEEYVACPYFYVIDLGRAENITDWINSIETSKTKREIDFEVYVGFENVTDGNKNIKLEDFILAVNYEIIGKENYGQNIGDFRKLFFTTLHIITAEDVAEDNTLQIGNYADNKYYIKKYATFDNNLITLSKKLTGVSNTTATETNTYDTQFNNNNITKLTTNSISKSRIYLIEPLWYGKTVGRISITPYDMEPGYYSYNTLTSDQIIIRKPSERLNLQMGGVIFNQLEETSSEEYIKINRTQAVSSNLNNQPPDSLYQSRNLCDVLLERLFDTCYPQLKNKETETNISYLQTTINKVVNDAITDGDFVPPYTVGNERKGTFINVQESNEDAYDLELIGMIQPVNCTYSIHIIAQINEAKLKVTET